MIYKPYPYQDHGKKHIKDNPGAGLFLDMGLGKSVITLTAIQEMLDDLEVFKVLVVAPKRVAEDTWPSEIAKWDHLNGLRYSVVLGSEKERFAALRAPADVYVINRENIPWLVAHYQAAFPFDMVVIDESTSFKNSQAIRFKALRQVRPLVKRLVILTGTPRPNGLLDLWAQLYLLDMGQRLGKTITAYREKYFVPAKKNGHIVYSYKLRGNKDEAQFLGDDIYEREIYDKISDICISMKAEDYLDLPPCIERDIVVKLDDKARARYDQFERDQVLALTMEIDGMENITAINAAALSTKLLQYANGAVYNADRQIYEGHTRTLEALEDIVEGLNGDPVFVMYNFQHDRDRILQYLKGYKPRVLENRQDIADWNAGRIPVMLGQPKSVAYGLNLQDGGCNIIIFGWTWNAEEYLQFLKRIHRQGQKRTVVVNRIRVEGTMHDDVCEALERKIYGNEACMNAVKARIEKWT